MTCRRGGGRISADRAGGRHEGSAEPATGNPPRLDGTGTVDGEGRRVCVRSIVGHKDGVRDAGAAAVRRGPRGSPAGGPPRPPEGGGRNDCPNYGRSQRGAGERPRFPPPTCRRLRVHRCGLCGGRRGRCLRHRRGGARGKRTLPVVLDRRGGGGSSHRAVELGGGVEVLPPPAVIIGPRLGRCSPLGHAPRLPSQLPTLHTRRRPLPSSPSSSPSMPCCPFTAKASRRDGLRR